MNFSQEKPKPDFPYKKVEIKIKIRSKINFNLYFITIAAYFDFCVLEIGCKTTQIKKTNLYYK